MTEQAVEWTLWSDQRTPNAEGSFRAAIATTNPSLSHGERA